MRPRYQPTLTPRLLGARVELSKTEDGLSQRCDALIHDGFNDVKISVVIVVDENVAHSSNLIPRDGWFAFEQRRIKLFDRITDLHAKIQGSDLSPQLHNLYLVGGTGLGPRVVRNETAA